VSGTVGTSGQQITIRALDQNLGNGNYSIRGTTNAETQGAPCEYLRTRRTGAEYRWSKSFPDNSLELNLWAPQSIPVPGLAASQDHLEIEATDGGSEVFGGSTVFDPYGVGFGPEGSWVPDARMISIPPKSVSCNKFNNCRDVAWSVGHYTVEDGKKIYALICAPQTGGPFPVVIYNHGGFTGIYGAVDTNGWATLPPRPTFLVTASTSPRPTTLDN
jgi:hypothetical protein